jgi:hypothetical protein
MPNNPPNPQFGTPFAIDYYPAAEKKVKNKFDFQTAQDVYFIMANQKPLKKRPWNAD